MILKLTEFNVGECIRTGDRYVWNGERWTRPFAELDDLTRQRLKRIGLDPEQSYAAFQAEIRVQPPNDLLRDLSLAPYIPMQELVRLNDHDSRAWGWKHNSNRG